MSAYIISYRIEYIINEMKHLLLSNQLTHAPIIYIEVISEIKWREIVKLWILCFIVYKYLHHQIHPKFWSKRVTSGVNYVVRGCVSRVTGVKLTDWPKNNELATLWRLKKEQHIPNISISHTQMCEEWQVKCLKSCFESLKRHQHSKNRNSLS